MTSLNPASTKWDIGYRVLDCRCGRHGFGPLVMGILNVTPDSFSDGGKFFDIDSAVSAAMAIEAAGADIIDIGGESTRPYSAPVAVDVEIERVIPVLERLRGRIQIPISIDTSKASVAAAAIKVGAEIVNDVTGLQGDPEMAAVVAAAGVGVCLMHMRGTPQTMQDDPRYENVVEEVAGYLWQRMAWCIEHGILMNRICLDPGVGFGKSHQHNLAIVRNVSRFLALNRPLLIGHSRKGFIGNVLGDKTVDRDAGTLGLSLAVAAAGASIIRVHAVKPTVDALKLFYAGRK